eukprot:Macronucleus_296.p1 GENE.Macronucleus_296~~Macronucleus_296.p1  ORF type:complete len:381 (+),score=132.62 Macronucleus_296:1-1143(+)
MEAHKSFNGLGKIEDSCNMIMGLIALGAMARVIPFRQQYPNPNDPAAKKPKVVEMVPKEHQSVAPIGFYIFQVEAAGKSSSVQIKLILAVGLIFFFLLFRVWPDWLKQAMWYVSWYTLCFLIGMAIVRAIVWFAIFHIGIDFWIFPNYFIDSDNILDSFWPLLSCEKREDMFDFRMLIVRIVSAIAISYGVQEFLKDPENLDSLTSGGQEIWDEMYDWGHHKFMGTVDPNQQIEVKKSARQIYAEAFMEDENPMFRTNTHFANVADDDSVREAQAKWEEEQKMTAEERARRKFEESLEEEDDAPNAAAAAAAKEQESSGDAASTDADSEDLLDKLTGNTDEGDDDEAQEETKAKEPEAAKATKTQESTTASDDKKGTAKQ